MKKFIKVMIVSLILFLSFFYYLMTIKDEEVYFFMAPIKDNIFVFEDSSFKNGLIDVSSGEIIVSNIYDDLQCIQSEDICISKLDNKYGLIDLKGNILIENKYDYIKKTNNDRLIAVSDQIYQIVDRNGNSIVEPLEKGAVIYDFISSDYIIVINNGNYGIIDSQKNIIVDYLPKNIKITKADETNGIIYLKSEDGKYGFINIKENIIVNPIYEDILDFHEHISVAKINDHFGYINDKNKEIIEFIYQRANKYSEGLASVQFESKFGFIDNTGKVVIDYQYDFAYLFNNGLAYVANGYWSKTNGYYRLTPSEEFFINKDNKTSVEPIHNSSNEIDYENYYYYSHPNYYFITENGLVYYKKHEDNYGLTVKKDSILNQNGEVLIQKTINDIYYPSSNMFCINKDYNTECYNMLGEKIIEHQYSLYYSVHYYYSGYNVFKDENIMYVYDNQGLLIYKTENEDQNLIIAKSGKYLIFTNGKNVFSYNIETKEKKIIYTEKNKIRSVI
jgi:hypothetical protein